MTVVFRQWGLRRIALAVLFLGATAAVLASLQTSARALPQTVLLTGTLDADEFLIAVDPADSSRLLLCAEACFTRSGTEIGTIVIQGFDGDDRLTVHHNGKLASNATNDLTVSFDAGPGLDQLDVCTTPENTIPPAGTTPLPACRDGVTTTVSPGATADERVVTQSADGASVTITLNDVAVIDDRVDGPTSVAAGETANQITYRAAQSLGEVAVDVAAPYRFADKSSLTIDAAAGDDRVEVATNTGLTGTGTCAGTRPLCVRGGTGDDVLVAAGLGSAPDAAALVADAPGHSTLSGLASKPALDLVGMERVKLDLQSGADAFSVATTASADLVRVASTTDGVRFTGDLVTDGTAFNLPEISIDGDGTAPLALTVAAAGGADVLDVTTTSGDDALRLGPSDTDATNLIRDTSCSAALSACLEAVTDGAADFNLTLAGVETHRVEAGAGDDALDTLASLAAATTFRGGEGSDRTDVRGTGVDLAVALANSSVTQTGAGPVTATATELLAAHAGGASVRTTATDGDDALTFRPEDSFSGRLQRAGDPVTVELSEVGGANVVDSGLGSDTVTVEGTSTSERWAVGRTADLSVQVDTLLPVRIAGAEAAQLRGLGGDDRFDLTGDQGPEALTVDGGPDAGADRITFAEATVDAVVSVDDDLGTGQLAAGGPPVGLAGIERVDVEGDDGHGLTVRGSDASDAITQSGNTVTVGRTTDVVFSRFPQLTVDGGTAGDQLWLAPATTSGVQGITALGGGEDDQLTVLGTALSEQITYTVTGTDTGTLALPAGPPVSFAGTEDNALSGQTAPPSGDVLKVSTPSLDGTLTLEPGVTFDSGTVRFRDLAGTSATATPLHFGGLGRGEVEFTGTAATAADRVLLFGQPDDDVLALTKRATAAGQVAVVTVDQQLPVVLAGARTLVLDGGDGPDSFRVPADHPIPGGAGPGIEVRGGGADTGDQLRLTASGGDVQAELPVATFSEAGHSGVRTTDVERVDLAAGTGDVVVAGGPDPDAITWEPTGGHAGLATAAGAPVVALSEVGDLTVEPGAGSDQVTVQLRTAADDATIDRGPTTEVSAIGLQSVLVPDALESLTLATRDGSDQILVTGAGGPASLAVDGGAPTVGSDLLRLEAEHVDVSYATDPTSGQLGSSGGGLSFAAIEQVDLAGTGAGALSVNGTGGSETLTIGEETVPLIGIDEAAAVTYAGYPDVTLDGRAGDDDIMVGYGALGDIETLRVDGGTGTGDGVTVADTPGTTRTLTVRPLTPTEGRINASGIATTIEVSETEQASWTGRSGDDVVQVVSPSGAQLVTATPGTTPDSGGVRVDALIPLEFGQVGAAGTLALLDEDGGRVDDVVLRGTPQSDLLAVDGTSGRVRLSGWVTLLPDAALDLSILGADGDDDTTISGPVPFRTTTFDGGSPDLGDSLAIEGPTGPVEVSLGATSITGYGGVVRFPGVVDLTTDVGGQMLTTVGTARDDALCYDPMSPRDGRMYIVGAPGGGTAASICLPDQRGLNVLHTFLDVGTLRADPGAGSDEIIVNGTTSRDLVTVHAHAPYTTVAVHPEPESGSTFRLPVEVLVATTESVVVAADNGSDTVDVSTYDSSAPLISVFGEGPSTMQIGDSLLVRDATGAANLHNTTSHTKGAGTATATYTKGSGAVIRIDYDGMENFRFVKDPKSDSGSGGNGGNGRG
jgi:hypothetical protein